MAGMASRDTRAAITLTAAAAALMLGASGDCVPSLAPFGKAGGAVTPSAPLGGIGSTSQCPSFAAYQTEVEPAIQRLCISCHGPGGRGAGKLYFQQGDPTNTDLQAANFYVARNEAVPIGGTVDPNSPDNTSPLLERLNGTITHDMVLGQASNDYFAFWDWVNQEIAQTCVIDPNSGNVTVTTTASPSPSPGP
jgi:hypothetical protein